MVIYSVIIAAVLIFLFRFRNYKKTDFEGLDKKEHRLRRIYPQAEALADIVLRSRISQHLGKRRKKFQKLYALSDAKGQEKLYLIRQMALLVVITLLFSILGLAVSFSNFQNERSYIKTLARAEPGGGSREYELKDSYGNLYEISLQERRLNEDAAAERLKQIIPRVNEKILGENESAQSVSKRLNFFETANIAKVSIKPENLRLISFSGEIVADFSEKEVYETVLFVELSYEGSVLSYELPLTLVRPDLPEQQANEALLQEYVNSEENIFSSEIKLPSKINGRPVGFIKPSEDDSAYYIILLVIAIVLVCVMYEKRLDSQLEKRKEELLLNYPELVSKMALLTEAGLNISAAWQVITNDSEKKKKGVSYLHAELALTNQQIKNGQSEGAAYAAFGKRCGPHQYIKFGNLLEQNLSKGNRGMADSLMMEARLAFEERKRLARKKGEQAGTKLIVPMLLMMLVVIVIIVVPALMSMEI